MKEDSAPWQYKPGSGSDPAEISGEEAASESKTKDYQPITWTASEYIDHDNGLSWYALLGALTVIISGGIFVLTRDMLATGTIVILGVIVAFAAKRKPRQISYQVAPGGIKIGDKTYNFRLFRSFYIVKEGDLHSISLMPIKRLSPALSIYFDPADEDKIVKRLAAHLPFEEHEMDAVERLARRLRF